MYPALPFAATQSRATGSSGCFGYQSYPPPFLLTLPLSLPELLYPVNTYSSCGSEKSPRPISGSRAKSWKYKHSGREHTRRLTRSSNQYLWVSNSISSFAAASTDGSTCKTSAGKEQLLLYFRTFKNVTIDTFFQYIPIHFLKMKTIYICLYYIRRY